MSLVSGYEHNGNSDESASDHACDYDASDSGRRETRGRESGGGSVGAVGVELELERDREGALSLKRGNSSPDIALGLRIERVENGDRGRKR